MPRTVETELAYARFIASRCLEERLMPFDRSAVAKIVEHGSRLCAHQEKLSARFGLIADIVREASYWAGKRGAKIATADDVRQTIDEQTYRANEAEERLQEQFDENTIMVTTTGRVVGQVNGLAVLDMGDYSFGQPSRITAQTYMGEEGVVNIDREVEMAGPLHNKGLLTLIGYLGGTYAQDQPLSLSASVSFEQNYGGVDGDSASSAELYALLSSLSGLSVHQGRAVTGSVNQRGEVQPIGGVTEKIEGFFKLCHKRGLTGDQGVLIPAGNAKHLMVNEEVLQAVAKGQFHVWAVESIDQGIELLMDVPAGKRGRNGDYPKETVHHLVQARLRELAEELKQFGEDDE
jgi:predicted ATP-dependent protease